MCYKCGICSFVSKPRTIMKRYTEYKNHLGHKQIAREVPVCESCYNQLHNGKTFTKLYQECKTLRWFECRGVVVKPQPTSPVSASVPSPVTAPVPTPAKLVPVKFEGEIVKPMGSARQSKNGVDKKDS